MSDNNQYDDLFEDDTEVTENQEQNEDGPAKLRRALKKEAQKRKELETELEEIRTEKRESELKKVVEDAGLPLKVANLRDFKEAEDPQKWIEENRGLFGAAEETNADESAQSGTPSLTPEQIAQMQSVVDVQPGSFTPGARDQQNAQLATAKSREEVYAILAQQGRLEGRAPV